MPRPHRISALSMLLMLAACGGGGGDGGTGTANLESASTPPAAQAPAQVETYAAAMSGAEQVPPRISSAQGSASVTVNAATRQMTVSVMLSGMSATAVNLQQGAPGSTGATVLALAETAPGSGVWAGRTTLSAVEHAALRAGQFYVTATSAAFTAGEIRGQIMPRPNAGGAPAGSASGATTGTTPGTTTGAATGTSLR